MTVYIDDVTISGDSVSPAKIWEIKEAIHKSGLIYHKEKLFVDRPAEVTGVFVDGLKLSIPDKQFKKRRELLDNRSKRGSNFSDKELIRLVGVEGQIKQVKAISSRI